MRGDGMRRKKMRRKNLKQEEVKMLKNGEGSRRKRKDENE